MKSAKVLSDTICGKRQTISFFDWPFGRVHFMFYDGCDSLELNVEDYKCEVGSLYMNAIKMLYR